MPKKPVKRKRCGIFIYCTEREKARLKAMAAIKNATLSGYVMRPAMETLSKDEARMRR